MSDNIRVVDGVTFTRTRDLQPARNIGKANFVPLLTEKWDGGPRGGTVTYRGQQAGTQGYDYYANGVWSNAWEKAARRAIARAKQNYESAKTVIAAYEGAA